MRTRPALRLASIGVALLLVGAGCSTAEDGAAARQTPMVVASTAAARSAPPEAEPATVVRLPQVESPGEQAEEVPGASAEPGAGAPDPAAAAQPPAPAAQAPAPAPAAPPAPPAPQPDRSPSRANYLGTTGGTCTDNGDGTWTIPYTIHYTWGSVTGSGRASGDVIGLWQVALGDGTVVDVDVFC